MQQRPQPGYHESIKNAYIIWTKRLQKLRLELKYASLFEEMSIPLSNDKWKIKQRLD